MLDNTEGVIKSGQRKKRAT